MQPTNNLHVFRILYLVKGILTLVFSLFFIIYAAFGAMFFTSEEFINHGNSIDFNPGYIFLIIGAIGFIICIIAGISQLLAARYLKQIRNHSYIMVVAIFSCLTGILGILLGVFTIIELQKPHVKELFEAK